MRAIPKVTIAYCRLSLARILYSRRDRSPVQRSSGRRWCVAPGAISSNGLLCQPPLLPCLKRQHGPEERMPVMCTRNVLTPAPADNAWVEYSFGRKPPLRKEAFGPIAQLIPKPCLNGHREALLRPVDQVLRNIPV